MDPVRATVSPPLVGRERLREELRRAVDDAMAGRVLLAGEPGIGKTALAAEAAAHAAGRGAAVAWGACWEEGGGQGFWPWTQVIRALPGDRPVAADLAVLSGSVDPAGPGSAERVDQPRAVITGAAGAPGLLAHHRISGSSGAQNVENGPLRGEVGFGGEVAGGLGVAGQRAAELRPDY